MRPAEFKRWRSELGLTQAKVAQLFGVSRVTIQNWEYGKTPVPEAAESLWLRQAWQWRRRPEYGPVKLSYYVGPPNHLNAYNLRIEEFPDNKSALQRAREVSTNPELHFIGINDMSDEPVWLGQQLTGELELMTVRERRNAGAVAKVPGLAERLMEIGRDFSSLPPGPDPDFTMNDLYDEDGLPK